MDAGYSSGGSTVFPSERPHESQFGGFETGSYSLDERSWADETEWTTPDKLPSQDLSEWFEKVFLAIETNEIAGSAMNGGPMDSLNDHQSNQIETSEASFQTETGGGGKSNLTPAQREKKRKNDAKYRKNIEEKIRLLHGLVPGGSKVTQKVQMLDETINYVRSLQRQVEEAAEQIAENKHLKKENEQLNAENTRLKDQLGLLVKQHQHQSVSVLLGNDQHATNFEAVDKEIVPVNAASLMSEGYIILPNVNECQFNVESQLNATEAPRDSCLQVEEIPHNNDRGSESLFPSNEEAKQGTCGSHNQYDEDEFSFGAEEEPFADGIGGEPSAKVLSSNKRKRSIEDAEVDQVKRGLEEKDSDESPEKRDCNLTTTTYMSTRKEGRGGCQASDPPKVEYIHIQAGRGQTNNSISRAKRAAIQNINERMKILQDLVPGCSKVAGKVPVLDEIINYLQSLQRQVEFLSMKLSAFNPVSNGNADAASTDILMKLEADDESTVKFSDFTGLDGERIKVGKYSVPLSLHPIVQNIIDVYGDVTATCKMNPCAAEANYEMFCASIKEMSDLRLKQVTEDQILKWRDAINDALRINFKVDFAKKHLKKVTCAYIGLIERRKLDNVALRIVHFEAQFRAGKEEHAKICTQSKAFMDAAEEFNEKPVSSGIFQSLPVIV